MNDVISGSLLVRFMRVFKNVWKYSACAAVAVWLSSVFTSSRLYIFLSGARQPAVRHSFIGTVYRGFHALVASIGAKVGLWWRCGLLGRVLHAVRRWVGLRCENSAAFRFCKFIGFRRFIIICFAMYIPLDVAVRAFVPIEWFVSIWDEAFMLLGLAYVVVRRARGRAPKGTRLSAVDMPLGLFFVTGLCLMLIVSPDMLIAVEGARAVIQYLPWFYIMIRLLETDDDLHTFLFSFVALGVGMGLHALYQYAVAEPIPAAWVTRTEEGVRTRAFSLPGSPNILGSFFVFCAPIAAGFAYFFKKTPYKLAMWAAVGIMCLGCLFTHSRGAWLGLGLAIIIFALLADKKLLLIGLLAGLGVIIIVPEATSRLLFLFTPAFTEATASGGRAMRWEFGYELLAKNPVFGYGLGRFGGAVAMHNQIDKDIVYFYLDNYYLKTAVEMGYSGLLTYLLTLATTVVTGIKSAIRSRAYGMSPLASGLLAGLCGVLLHCYYENIFEVPYMNAYFYGLAAAMVYIGYFRNMRPAANGEKITKLRSIFNV